MSSRWISGLRSAAIGVMVGAVITGCANSRPKIAIEDLKVPRLEPCPENRPEESGSGPRRAAANQMLQGVMKQASDRTNKGASSEQEESPPPTIPTAPTTPTPTSRQVAKTIDVLCLSGGGQYGAFGAGFLTGWANATKHRRPEFDVVTGVSTGSMISTFALLGKEYDAQLEEAYLDAAKGEKVFKERGILCALMSDSLATRDGLEKRLKKQITEEIVRKVALEADRKRTLLVGTVNLDTGQMTYWNLTRIAQIGKDRPEKMDQAIELYRTVLLAATAIPGALPPVLIDRDKFRDFFEHDASCDPIVAPDWTRGATMHCDGGARQNIFALSLSNGLIEGIPEFNKDRVYVYLIGNGTISDDEQITEDGLIPIGVRAVNVLLTEAMRGNIAAIGMLATNQGWHLRIAYLQLSDECKAVAPTGGGLVDAFKLDFMECIMKQGEARGLETDDKKRWNDIDQLLNIPPKVKAIRAN